MASQCAAWHGTAQHSTAQLSSAQLSSAQLSSDQLSSAQLSSAPTCSHGVILTCSILAFKPELAAGVHTINQQIAAQCPGAHALHSPMVCATYKAKRTSSHVINITGEILQPSAKLGNNCCPETNIPHVCCMCWVNKLQHKLLSRSEQKTDFSVCDQAACHH